MPTLKDIKQSTSVYIKHSSVVVDCKNVAWVLRKCSFTYTPTDPSDIVLYLNGKPLKADVYLNTLRPWKRVNEVLPFTGFEICKFFMPNSHKPVMTLPKGL